MAAVAKRLLDDGVSVNSIYADAFYDDHEIKDDLAGSVHFNKAFQGGIKGDSESFLQWGGTSGWCYRTVCGGSFGSSFDSRRWLGESLMPSPDRVAAFVSAIRVDPQTAGEDERPFYRTPYDQLNDLAADLRSYAPGPQHGPLAYVNYEHRFAEMQGVAYRERVVKALLSGDDRILFLPIRNSELHALLHLLDYTEAAAPLTGPHDLSQSLAQDLSRRTPGDHYSVHQHQHAVVLAVSQQDLSD